MRKIALIAARKFLISFALLALAGSATAMPIMVNFQKMADGAYGESAWSPLSLKADFGIDVDIYGVYGSKKAYAYLDAGTAGLGVCRELNTSATANLKNSGNRANRCLDASDDNVKGAGEGFDFVFNEDVSITKIWLNNNHDRDWGLTDDTVIIGGVNHTFTGGADHADLGWLFEFPGPGVVNLLFASDHMDIAFYDPGTVAARTSGLRGEEFYISAIEFSIPVTVPAPATIAVFGLGLISLGLSRRINRKSGS